MKRIETNIPGVYFIEPKVYCDTRGFFFESYNQSNFANLGITNHFVQVNHSMSIKGTLRGLHYQLKHAQSKLFRVTQGEVFDVVADIRKGSPTFRQWFSVILSAENKRHIYPKRLCSWILSIIWNCGGSL